ncbi:Dbl homology domain-containing protein [Rozella allomycis CSF55]|uniref:Dbl homology domain-containing protein n=1 Tax=Rozella allomycis (strain CSF55) TaxID=988480 RepID=A0A4P9YMA9_ROZAC|nr:Dbl homology domain-containing protein [Rozella allomycis CSF55]RKP20823.1 Dbl homology domain-containing protein [Rozella allomycis CSF55]
MDSIATEFFELNMERRLLDCTFELFQTEMDYYNDLVVFDTIFRSALKGTIVANIFDEILPIIKLHKKIQEDLNRITNARDLFVMLPLILNTYASDFACYEPYTTNQVYVSSELEKARKNDPSLDKLLLHCEDDPRCRRLALQSFLTRPATRLARYPLLIEAILKRMPDYTESAIYHAYLEFENSISEVLRNIDKETGFHHNKARIAALKANMEIRDPNIKDVEINLDDPNRRLVRDGLLKRRLGIEIVETIVVLLDNYESLNETKMALQKIRKMDLRFVIVSLEEINESSNGAVVKSSSVKKNSFHTSIKSELLIRPVTKFPIFLYEATRNKKDIQLFASNMAEQRQWINAIKKQIEENQKISSIYSFQFAQQLMGLKNETINCSLQITNQGRKYFLYATNLNLYFFDSKLHQLFVLLPFEIKMHSWKDRRWLVRGLVYSGLGVATPNGFWFVFEPVLNNSGFSVARMFKKGKENLKLYRKLYIASESLSLFFFKTKLCIGCKKGFEVVDIETITTQELLDPRDPNLVFAFHENRIFKPLAIFRLNETEFLPCFDDYGFFVNKTGKRTRETTIMKWNGIPHSFKMHQNHLFCFCDGIIEIYDISTCQLVQVIHSNGVKLVDRCDEHLIVTGDDGEYYLSDLY